MKSPPCKARTMRVGRGTLQQGLQQGFHTVLERQLSKRFGPLSAETRQRLTQATPEQLKPGLNACSMHPLSARSLSRTDGN
jgi:hypothetical protein